MTGSQAASQPAPSTSIASSSREPYIVLDPDVIVIEDDPEDPVFTLFPDLPIELRLKIWEHAFPGRVVNLIYDQYHDRFHSFNSTTPMLLHIHRETREMGLKLYQLCFGTESFEPRIYFDFNKDILLFDDYLFVNSPHIHQSDADSTSYRNPLQYADYPLKSEEEAQIQRVAINSGIYHHISNPDEEARADQMCMVLKQFVRPLASKFAALKDLSIVIEDVNPYSRAAIRSFNVGHDACDPICDVCYVSKLSQVPIEHLRKIYGKMLKFHLVGAYRGSSRFSLGCYDKVVEKDPRDDISFEPDPEDLPDVYIVDGDYVDPDVEYSYDSEDGELEKSLNKHLKKADLWEGKDYPDVDQSFSDHENEEDADSISPEELQDIRDDEKLYREFVVGGQPYIRMQDEWVHPNYYDVRMTL